MIPWSESKICSITVEGWRTLPLVEDACESTIPGPPVAQSYADATKSQTCRVTKTVSTCCITTSNQIGDLDMNCQDLKHSQTQQCIVQASFCKPVQIPNGFQGLAGNLWVMTVDCNTVLVSEISMLRLQLCIEACRRCGCYIRMLWLAVHASTWCSFSCKANSTDLSHVMQRVGGRMVEGMGTLGAPCSLSHLAACLISSTAWGKSKLPISCTRPHLHQAWLRV